jgi:hypothetical protein
LPKNFFDPANGLGEIFPDFITGDAYRADAKCRELFGDRRVLRLLLGSRMMSPIAEYGDALFLEELLPSDFDANARQWNSTAQTVTNRLFLIFGSYRPGGPKIAVTRRISTFRASPSSRAGRSEIY